MSVIKTILDFLNAYSNALMVLITLVYAVVTYFILRANKQSVQAMKAQLMTSEQQYEEQKRLAIKPYIQFEKTTGSAEYELPFMLDSGDNCVGKYVLILRMKNIGHGTAQSVSYIYQWDNGIKSYDKGAFPVQAFAANENYGIKIVFAYTMDRVGDRRACIVLSYKDLLDYEYTQELNVAFGYNASRRLEVTELKTTPPTLVSTQRLLD